MWRTVPYSNAAGRREGFHNLLFLWGDRRERREEGKGGEWEEVRDGN